MSVLRCICIDKLRDPKGPIEAENLEHRTYREMVYTLRESGKEVVFERIDGDSVKVKISLEDLIKKNSCFLKNEKIPVILRAIGVLTIPGVFWQFMKDSKAFEEEGWKLNYLKTASVEGAKIGAYGIGLYAYLNSYLRF